MNVRVGIRKVRLNRKESVYIKGGNFKARIGFREDIIDDIHWKIDESFWI